MRKAGIACGVAITLLTAAHSYSQGLMNEEGSHFGGNGSYNEFFPGNIFKLRPAHVRKSLPSENASQPRSRRHFPFFEPPPSTPLQNSVVIRENDPITAVYPVSAGSFSSLGGYQVDRLGIHSNRIILDVFTVPLDVVGATVVAPNEAGFFLGAFAPGDYELEVRHWFIPREYREQFDVNAFDPNEYLAPVYEQTPFSLVTSLSDVSLTYHPLQPSTAVVPFRVHSVPEPASLGIALMSLVALVQWRLSRARA